MMINVAFWNTEIHCTNEITDSNRVILNGGLEVMLLIIDRHIIDSLMCMYLLFFKKKIQHYLSLYTLSDYHVANM